MKRVYIILLLFLLTSCSPVKEQEETAEETAGQVYDIIIDENSELPFVPFD